MPKTGSKQLKKAFPNYKRKVFFPILIGCLLLQMLSIFEIKAQNADIDLLKKINPEHPNSNFWKGVSGTAYPFALLLPGYELIKETIHPSEENKISTISTFGSLVFNIVGTTTIKKIVNRNRPYDTYPLLIHPASREASASFPSAHTSVAFWQATTLLTKKAPWYIVIPAYTEAGLVGYSRLYLGEHYPSDVIAGAVIGSASALLCHYLTEKILLKKNKAKKPVIIP